MDVPPANPAPGRSSRQAYELRIRRVLEHLQRHRGPYDTVTETRERFTAWVGRECLFGPEKRLFGRCWDDSEVTPADKLRYDPCVAVSEAARPSDGVGIDVLPAGRYAVVLPEGPYERPGETCAALLGLRSKEAGREFVVA